VRAKLKSNDGMALRRAALDGMGITLLADYLVAPSLASHSLQAVLPDYKLPDLWLKALVPANRIDLPRIRSLLQWLTLQLQAVPLGGEPAIQAADGRQ